MILNIPDPINTLVHSIISSSPKIVSNSQKLNFPLDVSNAVERVVFTRIIYIESLVIYVDIRSSIDSFEDGAWGHRLVG